MGSFSVWHWMILILFFVLLVPQIMYIPSIQTTLRAIPEDKREMSPGSAWLLLIPFFSYIWIFFVVIQLTQSFKNLEEVKMLRSTTDASYSTGLAMAICSVLTLFASWVPIAGLILAIASLVLWVLYWVGIVNARKEIILA